MQFNNEIKRLTEQFQLDEGLLSGLGKLAKGAANMALAATTGVDLVGIKKSYQKHLKPYFAKQKHEDDRYDAWLKDKKQKGAKGDGPDGETDAERRRREIEQAREDKKRSVTFSHWGVEYKYYEDTYDFLLQPRYSKLTLQQIADELRKSGDNLQYSQFLNIIRKISKFVKNNEGPYGRAYRDRYIDVNSTTGKTFIELYRRLKPDWEKIHRP